MAYATKAEVVALGIKLKPDLVEADIPDYMLDATKQIIDEKTGRIWEIFTGDVYIDGQGQEHIKCPKLPITSLSAITIIASDTVEEILDVAGTDRQAWWNDHTGIIRRIQDDEDDSIEKGQKGEALTFPIGLKNIKLTGVFGVDPATYPVLKLLTVFLVFQQLGFIFPDKFKLTDLAGEKIGEYSYTIQGSQYETDNKNKRKTLDGYINWLFSILGQPEAEGYLAI